MMQEHTFVAKDPSGTIRYRYTNKNSYAAEHDCAEAARSYIETDPGAAPLSSWTVVEEDEQLRPDNGTER